jgi:thioester reductase-like protein
LITPKDRTLQLISFSFDGFGANLYPSILSGAELVLVKNSVRTDYMRVSKLIKEKEITNMSIVPSMYREILKNSINGELDSIRFVVLGGEESDGELIFNSRDKYPNILLANEYGPTENTIASTCFVGMTPEDTKKIGCPIDNTKAYIIDKHNNMLPSYVLGELCVMGEGITRGYLNEPALTKERFIQCPFAPGRIMYKTGDLARKLDDGSIEFFGRIDNQVKIRGFRIELGEIEDKLLKHNNIKAAVVVAREDANGNKHLCAYFVPVGKYIKGHDLRDYLFKVLPDYMVPTYFIQLDKMPLTPNGKIDRGALLNKELKKEVNLDFSLPTNEVEVKLVEAWQEVLGIKNIGIDDNIFEYGVDSLTIMRVLANVLKYSWDITLQDFYECQTIRKLSNKILGNYIAGTYEEAAVASSIITLDQRKKSSPITGRRELKNILLTGATGFLGTHLLGSILENTQASVYCLVRGENGSSAENRLLRRLEFYFGDKYNSLINKRIFVLTGDIICERLGLSFKEYLSLSREIDTVIHTAALVKHFGSYSDFEKVNVLGTGRIIDFCNLSGAKLKHISTVSVSGDLFEQNGENILFTENDFNIGQNLGGNVYLKSKFDTEKMILESARKGLDISIFRVGNLTGRYSDGLFQSNIDDNWFYGLLKFFITLKTISTDIYEWRVELTPVDICANAVLELTKLYDCKTKIFHLFNDNKVKMGDIVKVFDSLESNITVVDSESYRKKIEQIANDVNSKDILIGIVNVSNQNKTFNTASSTEVSCKITKSILKQLGIEWPEVDHEYLKRLFQYMLTIGFIS